MIPLRMSHRPHRAHPERKDCLSDDGRGALLLVSRASVLPCGAQDLQSWDERNANPYSKALF